MTDRYVLWLQSLPDAVLLVEAQAKVSVYRSARDKRRYGGYADALWREAQRREAPWIWDEAVKAGRLPALDALPGYAAWRQAVAGRAGGEL